MTLEELEKLPEEELEIDKSAFKVDRGICPSCKEKMTPLIENKDLFDGTLTIHLIKFRCEQCKKEYLDLEQAEKYDLFLKLESISNEGSLALLQHCLENGKVSA